jgi:hypothetical protein
LQADLHKWYVDDYKKKGYWLYPQENQL